MQLRKEEWKDPLWNEVRGDSGLGTRRKARGSGRYPDRRLEIPTHWTANGKHVFLTPKPFLHCMLWVHLVILEIQHIATQQKYMLDGDYHV